MFSREIDDLEKEEIRMRLFNKHLTFNIGYRDVNKDDCEWVMYLVTEKARLPGIPILYAKTPNEVLDKCSRISQECRCGVVLSISETHYELFRDIPGSDGVTLVGSLGSPDIKIQIGESDILITICRFKGSVSHKFIPIPSTLDIIRSKERIPYTIQSALKWFADSYTSLDPFCTKISFNTSDIKTPYMSIGDFIWFAKTIKVWPDLDNNSARND